MAVRDSKLVPIGNSKTWPGKRKIGWIGTPLPAMNEHLETVVVCPLTTQLHPHWRSRIQIRCAGADAEIAVDQIRALSKRRLVRVIGRLNGNQAAEVRRLITEMYGVG